MTERARTSERTRNQEQEKEHEREHNRTKEEPERECPDCSSTGILDEAHAELICEDCGFVLDDQRIDHGPEWRVYTSQENGEQAGIREGTV